MNAGCAGKTEIPWERVPYLSALEVWSRQGAIQIHVYLNFTLPLPVDTVGQQNARSNKRDWLQTQLHITSSPDISIQNCRASQQACGQHKNDQLAVSRWRNVSASEAKMLLISEYFRFDYSTRGISRIKVLCTRWVQKTRNYTTDDTAPRKNSRLQE